MLDKTCSHDGNKADWASRHFFPKPLLIMFANTPLDKTVLTTAQKKIKDPRNIVHPLKRGAAKSHNKRHGYEEG